MAEEKTVNISEEALKKLIGEIETLKQMVTGGVQTEKAQETEYRKVKVRFIDGKPIVGLANRGSERNPVYAYEIPDPFNKGDKKLMLDVILLGDKNPIALPYNDIVNEAEAYDCKIVNVKEFPWQIDQGEVERVDVKFDKFRSESTGEYVPARVKGVRYEYEVEDPLNEGQTIKLSEKVINM